MSTPNRQMFALATPPPERIELKRRRYRLERVFKHDFFAATCLYRPVSSSGQRIVVKFARSQAFCGLPMDWLGRWLGGREERIYRVLTGLEGLPRWLGRVGRNAHAIAYVGGRPLDHVDEPPEGFFDRLAALMRTIHDRGVAYCDANKRSNILVSRDGRPCLVDFQISLCRRDGWPWPFRKIIRWAVEYAAARDIYHVYKHKRRMCPQRVRPEEEALSRRRTGLHRVHRSLTKPWRRLRRKFLREQFTSGRLVSPTAALEDHHQPEKATWRPAKETDR